MPRELWRGVNLVLNRNLMKQRRRMVTVSSKAKHIVVHTHARMDSFLQITCKDVRRRTKFVTRTSTYGTLQIQTLSSHVTQILDQVTHQIGGTVLYHPMKRKGSFH